MSATWVVVADASRARIFAAEKPTGDLVEIEDLAHPEARMHAGDFTTDRPGTGKHNGSGSFGMGSGSSLKDEEAERFATTVCSTMENARCRGDFKGLYVIAAPSFLGRMRRHQSNAMRQSIKGEIAKNLGAHDAQHIREHLPRQL